MTGFPILIGEENPVSELPPGISRGPLIVQSGHFQSMDFSTGVSGWIIRANGDVEFNDGVFRGTITATAGSIGGFTLGTDYIRDAADSFGLASTVTGGDDVRFWAGDTFANRATADFRVTEAGVLTANTVNALGDITVYGDHLIVREDTASHFSGISYDYQGASSPQSAVGRLEWITVTGSANRSYVQLTASSLSSPTRAANLSLINEKADGSQAAALNWGVTGATVPPTMSLPATAHLQWNNNLLDTTYITAGTDQLNFWAGGVEMLRLTEDTNDQVFIGPAGSTTVPSLSWISDPNTGFSNAAADNLSILVGGVEAVIFDVNGIEMAGKHIETGSLGASGEIRLRSGFAVAAVGGSGLKPIEHAGGNADGLGLYGHDGISLWVGQAKLFEVLAASINSVAIRDDTTASAANVRSDVTTGRLQRSTSSLRYKTNLRPLTGALDTLKRFHPTWFDSIADDGRTFLGYGAEHVAAVIPEAYGDENYDPRAIIALLHEAILEQQAHIEALEAA